jgi:hypothetical protein
VEFRVIKHSLIISIERQINKPGSSGGIWFPLRSFPCQRPGAGGNVGGGVGVVGNGGGGGVVEAVLEGPPPMSV